MQKFSTLFFLICFTVTLAYANEATSTAAADDNGVIAETPSLNEDVSNTEDSAKIAESEMTISSDRMEMHYGERIELEGNVVVSDDTKMLTADRMIVELDANNQAQKIEAIGQVSIRNLENNDSATGNRGIYNLENKKIILEGDCSIIHEDKNGRHILNSQQVVYDVTTKSFYSQAIPGDSKQRPTITLPAKSSDNSNLSFDKLTKKSSK